MSPRRLRARPGSAAQNHDFATEAAEFGKPSGGHSSHLESQADSP